MTNEHARKLSELARKGRMKKISPERRQEIARNAALARWGQTNKKRTPSQ